MIEVVMNENHNQVMERTQKPDIMPCLICGRPCEKPENYLRFWWASHAVTYEEAKHLLETEGSGGDMGYYPIGSACLKKHPELKPYVEDAIAHVVEIHKGYPLPYKWEDWGNYPDIIVKNTPRWFEIMDGKEEE